MLCTVLRFQVSEIDASGSVLRSFGHERGIGPDRLNEPHHVIIDSIGRVLVADTGNRRVILLTEQLGLDRVLANFDVSNRPEMTRPYRLCLIDDLAQLVVSYVDSRDVNVFRVRPK